MNTPIYTAIGTGSRFIPFAPVDSETADLLTLVADVESPVGRDVVTAFLEACKADADAHGGIVSVNRVSAALPDDITSTERYSSLWGHYTGRGKPMRKATSDDIEPPWDIRKGSRSGNDGKPVRLRKWVGA